MLDDKTLAMLGDRDAQERLTERGELLQCTFGCTCIDVHTIRHNRFPLGERGWKTTIECKCCFSTVTFFSKDREESEKNAIRLWNTRAPILTPEQIKRLEEME